MLDERKTAILRAVVQEYIATGQPVGSAHVAAIAGVKVSPATVRNDMAMLEQEGYLVQPHTSAGRIPTDKGYRFFVDALEPAGKPNKVIAWELSVAETTVKAHVTAIMRKLGVTSRTQAVLMAQGVNFHALLGEVGTGG